MHAKYGRRAFTESNFLRTDSWTEAVTGIRTPANGIVMTKALIIPERGRVIQFHPGAGVDLPAHSLVTIRTYYRVTDCLRATTGALPIVIHLRRLWLNTTVSYQGHSTDFPDAGKACGLYH